MSHPLHPKSLLQAVLSIERGCRGTSACIGTIPTCSLHLCQVCVSSSHSSELLQLPWRGWTIQLTAHVFILSPAHRNRPQS